MGDGDRGGHSHGWAMRTRVGNGAVGGRWGHGSAMGTWVGNRVKNGQWGQGGQWRQGGHSHGWAMGTRVDNGVVGGQWGHRLAMGTRAICNRVKGGQWGQGGDTATGGQWGQGGHSHGWAIGLRVGNGVRVGNGDGGDTATGGRWGRGGTQHSAAPPRSPGSVGGAKWEEGGRVFRSHVTAGAPRLLTHLGPRPALPNPSESFRTVPKKESTGSSFRN